jgi:ubiquinone/menaquinone biosynthesis C-methylase UbiE
LADLSSANLAFAGAKAKEAGVELAGYDQVNALDLGRYASESFDAALVMGPLYHLIREGDRVQAVREVHRVLKPGGVALIASITRISLFRDSAQGYPDRVVDNWEKAVRILETGILDGMGGFTEAYLAHINEVEPLVKSGGFEPVAVVGCEGVVAGHETLINGLRVARGSAGLS